MSSLFWFQRRRERIIRHPDNYLQKYKIIKAIQPTYKRVAGSNRGGDNKHCPFIWIPGIPDNTNIHNPRS